MTHPPTGTLADNETAMLLDVAEVLKRHGFGHLRLLVAPNAPQDTPDTVYVQCRPDENGIIRIYPRRIEDLKPGELLHATQSSDPLDPEFSAYIAEGTHRCAQNCGIDSLTGIHQYA